MVCCMHCGELIKRSAAACPRCGSDERTGWSESTYLDGLDLPDDESYETIYEREFGTKPHSLPRRRTWIALIGSILLTAFIAGYLRVLC